MKFESKYFKVIDPNQAEPYISTDLDFDLINMKFDAELYEEQLTGKRSLREASAPGRSMPYFFGIKKDPMSFKLTLAINSFSVDEDIAKIVSKLVRPYYMTIQFSNELGVADPGNAREGIIENYNGAEPIFSDDNIFYDIIAIDAPTIKYIGVTKDSQNKKLVFLEMNFRCKHHSGYVIYDSENFVVLPAVGNVPMLNNGDDDVYPNLILQNNTSNTAYVQFENSINNSLFAIEIEGNETITLSMNTKTLETNNPEIYSEVYPRWGYFNGTMVGRSYLKLNPSSNSVGVQVQGVSANVSFKYSYKSPKFA